MKKGFGAIVGLVILVFSSTLSFAQGGYAGLEIGPVFLNDSTISVPSVGSAELSTDPGFGIGATLGHKFEQFRVEGELTLKTNDLDTLSGPGGSAPSDGDLSSAAIMINGYYDVKTESSVTPFIGAGIGFARVSLEWNSMGFSIADDSDMVLAYQAIAGLSFKIRERVTFDLAYKYFGTTDPSFTDVTGFPFDAEYNSHNLVLAVRFDI